MTPAFFDKIYKDHYRSLCYFAATHVDREVAKDLVSDVYLKVWELDKKDVDVKLLFNLVRFECFDYITKQSRRGRLLNNMPKDDCFILAELETDVIAAIYKYACLLPLKQKNVFFLKYFDGLSNSEITKLIGIKPQTLRNELSTALKLLRIKII